MKTVLIIAVLVSIGCNVAFVVFSTALLTHAIDFDSDLIPEGDYAFKIGDTLHYWSNIRSVIYFDGTGKVSIGALPLQNNARLQVNGLLRLNSGSQAFPPCTDPAVGGPATRGTLWVRQTGTDQARICVRDATGAYTFFRIN